jgi:hypothetical protein
MIRYLLLTTLLLNSLYGEAKIINFNLYERTERVDIVVSFDKIYEGIVSKKNGSNSVKLSLNGATIDEPMTRKLDGNNQFLSQVDLIPFENRIELIITLPSGGKPKRLSYSKISEGYGLRLQVFEDNGVEDAQNSSESSGETAIKPEGKSLFSSISPAYIITISTLIILVVALFFIKRRIEKRREESAELGMDNANWFERSNSDISLFGAKKSPEEEGQLLNSLQTDDIPIIKKRKADKSPDFPPLYEKPENPIVQKPPASNKKESSFPPPLQVEEPRKKQASADRESRSEQFSATLDEQFHRESVQSEPKFGKVIFEERHSIGTLIMMQYKSRRYLLLRSDNGVISVVDKFNINDGGSHQAPTQHSVNSYPQQEVEPRAVEPRTVEPRTAVPESSQYGHRVEKSDRDIEDLFKDSYELKI